MWYIKRGKNVEQYLSIYGGWRSPLRLSVRETDNRKPLLKQWFAELKQFKLQTEANRYIQKRFRKNAISVNMIKT